MKQGKSEDETNKIVNRIIIEKYDLLGKGQNHFNKKEWTGGENFNKSKDHSFEEMQELRKSDANVRFGIKEYVEVEETLVLEKSSNINQLISQEMNPKAPDWNGFKTFQGERLEKSQPDAHQVELQKSQDEKFNVPIWKGSERDIKNMVIIKSLSINERIQQDELKKSEKISFDNKYKSYDEEKTKLEKSLKTDSEVLAERIIKNNWKE
jgi:hypothetical protein